MDMCFELARLIGDALDGAVDVADEVHGFRYFDERDILGFVDGTENPEDQEPSMPCSSIPRIRSGFLSAPPRRDPMSLPPAGAGSVPGNGAPGYPGSTYDRSEVHA